MTLSSMAVTELQVVGMTCNNCARKVTNAAQAVPGVHSVSVDVAAALARVQWLDATEANVPAVLAAIARAGFAASELTAGVSAVRHGRWQGKLIFGLAVAGLLMLGQWVFGLSQAPWFQGLAFILAGAVQIYCGAEFYAGAWRQLRVGQSNMDLLVALGSSTAFGYSTWELLTAGGGHVYFMEAAAIISLISFGHWLEARVSDQASAALQALMRLAPATTRKLVSVAPDPLPQKASVAAPFDPRKLKFAPSNNRRGAATLKEVDVPVATLRVEDRVVLSPGDRVPVDGVVEEGASSVDEAMLTGESMPVDKAAGSELYAGTVNLNGRLVLRVTATGQTTALAHVIAAVQRAQTSRADIQRLGDRISSVFVPVIVVLALGAGLWWGWAPTAAGRVHEWLAPWLWHAHAPAGAAAGFMIAAAVLIIACPCAMGLATPAAIMAAANAAARRGILIRDGVALEKAGRITAVVFDKTGTLTMGRPQVVGIWQGADAQRGLGMPTADLVPQNAGPNPASLVQALALARPSTHPLSRAIAANLETLLQGHPSGAHPIAVGDWREVRGCGVEAKASASSAAIRQEPPMKSSAAVVLRLGSLRWLRENGVDLVPGHAFVRGWEGQGATLVGMAAGTELLALFALRDVLKAGAAAVVNHLQCESLKVYLLTGDHAPTANAIAMQVGIATTHVSAEVRPEQKAAFIQRLQAQGQRVAFVGDGINDAPALTQADLGIAVGRASDIAREAADIILLKSEIEAVPEALGLARAALRTIRQNLFWAFFYNSLGVPLAALGFISPVVCAAAMGASDLIVIGNALRLLRWRRTG